MNRGLPKLGRLAAIGAVLAACLTTAALAHRTDESYIFLSLLDDALEGRVEVRLGDLRHALPLDADGNGSLNEAEFETGEALTRSFFADAIELADTTGIIPFEWTGAGVIEVELGRYAALTFRAARPAAGAITVSSTALFDELAATPRPPAAVRVSAARSACHAPTTASAPRGSRSPSPVRPALP